MAEGETFDVVVQAGECGLQDALLSTVLDVPSDAALVLEEWDPQQRLLLRLPAQCVDGAWQWVLAGVTQPGQVRRFKAVISQAGAPNRERGVHFRIWHNDPHEDRALDIELDGLPLATYNYGSAHSGIWKPYLHPVLAPSGLPVTQNSEFPGTLRGHFWHRGLFVAHQRVNGVSFWEEREGVTERILHQEFLRVEDGPVVGRLLERNLWRTPEQRDLIIEHRELRFYRTAPDQRLFDITVELQPAAEAVTLGQCAYNLLACHVPRSMHVADPYSSYDMGMYRPSELNPRHRGGRVTNSVGEVNAVRDHVTAGARAGWTDHSGPVEGHWQGIAIMDCPANPRHPSYWLNWNNMSHGPSFTYAEPFTINPGERLTLRYRVYVHEDDAESGHVEQRWREWTQPPQVRVEREG